MSLPKNYRNLRDEFPGVAAAYDALGEAAYEAGPLDTRTAQLVKLALSIGARLEGATHSHVRRALAAGATPEEIKQIVALAISTLGFPAAAAAYSWIGDELDEG